MIDTEGLSEECIQFIEIIADINRFFKGDMDKTLLWMHTQNMHLGGSAPMTLVEKGRTHKLYQFVKAAREGY